METKICYRGYVIPYNQEHYELIKKDLTVKPFVLPDYDFNNNPFPVYRKSEKWIYLPKFYGIEKYGIPSINDERVGDDIDLEFKGSLKDAQKPVVEKVINTLNNNDSAVLSLMTGFGKTVVGLYTISKIKKKTLIIVHKEFLLNQWIERIKEFLPDARIGRIQKNVVDVENKDIVIAMLQSITVRKVSYPKETFDSFGYVLVDECCAQKQLVDTEDGPKKIGDLYNLWKNNERLPLVMSYNEKLNAFEYKQITYAWEKEKKELLKIKYGSGSIDCTDNHLILTPSGYKEAGKLSIGDLIKCKYSEEAIKNIQSILNEGIGYNGNVYDLEVKDNHNFVLANSIKNINGPIVHNCHRICSRNFSKALFQIATKKMLGLSATPDRKDGLTKVLTWFLGDIITIESTGVELKPEIRLVKAEYTKDAEPVPTYNVKGKINLPNLVTQISMDKTRNQQILSEIIKYNKEKRRILVLTERRQQCSDLLDLLPSGISGGLYVGGMKNELLEISNTKDVILATYAMAQEGYDNSCLDTLIMATGRSDIVQACGRILRRVNPNIPLIIDFQDSIEGLVGQAKKRELYYRKKKYTVKRCEAGGEYAVKRYEAGGESTDMQKFMFIDDD
jgi:superfamily II DNA or RNA helicase